MLITAIPDNNSLLLYRTLSSVRPSVRPSVCLSVTLCIVAKGHTL